jgi:hypothetical protein
VCEGVEGVKVTHEINGVGMGGNRGFALTRAQALSMYPNALM